MFLEKFELRLVSVDDKPVKPEDQYCFTFWDCGKIDRRSAGGKEEPFFKDDAKGFIAQIGCHYGITPEEFREALKKENQQRVKINEIKKTPS